MFERMSQVELAPLLGDLFDVLMKFRLELESTFSSIMVAFMISEGMGRSLHTGFYYLLKSGPVAC